MGEDSRSDRFTIRDVAQLAGVSPATVSKVLNDTPNVSEAARTRVEVAIGKLGYRPNAVARSLKAKRTRTVGLITDDLEGVFTASIIRGVEESTAQQGLSVLLCNSHGSTERERSDLAVLLDKQVDGIILMSGYRVRRRGPPALDTHGVPVVYLYQHTRDVSVPCVIPDDHGGGRLGATHLLASGRSRIGLINGPPHYEATRQRLGGVEDALREAGLALDQRLVRSGKWDESSGYRMARELLALPDPPDALFCMSDSLASGAIDALLELGIPVPGQMAIVGFDNRLSSAHQRPPLTTVALPLREMGRLAGELLMSSMNGDVPEARTYTVPCSLVVRESCGAPSPASTA